MPTEQHREKLIAALAPYVDVENEQELAQVLTVLEDKSGTMPSGPARKEAEAVAKSVREAVIVQAQVVEGDGFVAASIRALISGISLAIRAPYPNKVFKTVDEALPWVEQQLVKAGYPEDAAGVAAAVWAVEGDGK